MQHFNNKYIIESNQKKYVDLSGMIINDFIKMNIKNNNINYSPICSYEDELCYSYRLNSTNSRMYSIMSCK